MIITFKLLLTPTFVHRMGKALFQLGHIDEARDAVEEAQSIDSNDEIRLFLDEVSNTAPRPRLLFRKMSF